MCQCVCFIRDKQCKMVHFSDKDAVLPVVTRDGYLHYVQWGRRNQEAGDMPVGGWADLNDIHNGEWDKYFPKPVKIAVRKFSEVNFAAKMEWYDVVDGLLIQGLLVRHKTYLRVYVVTLKPGCLSAQHWRWPRFINDINWKYKRKST